MLKLTEVEYDKMKAYSFALCRDSNLYVDLVHDAYLKLSTYQGEVHLYLMFYSIKMAWFRWLKKHKKVTFYPTNTQQEYVLDTQAFEREGWHEAPASLDEPIKLLEEIKRTISKNPSKASAIEQTLFKLKVIDYEEIDKSSWRDETKENKYKRHRKTVRENQEKRNFIFTERSSETDEI